MPDQSTRRKRGEDSLPALLPDNMPVRRILVIKLRHFGDVLLTTPLLRTLKQHYPDALIDILVYDGTEVMLAGNRDVYLRYTVDRALKYSGLKAQFRGEKALWNSLKTWKYDLIINLSDQWRSALYCRFLKPAFSLGFNWPKRKNPFWRFCHSRLVDTSAHHKNHTVLNNLSILEPLNIPRTLSQVMLHWEQQDEQHIADLVHQYHLADYVVIHPGARWIFKTWSVQGFIELTNHLTREGVQVVLTGGNTPHESEIAQTILAGTHQPEKIVNLTGLLSLSELAVLLNRSRLFIGVDSAPMHMAAALKKPAVVLFGPSNIAQWHPWQAPHSLLWAGNYRILPNPNDVDTNTDERYLEAIPVCDVIAAADKWLFSAS